MDEYLGWYIDDLRETTLRNNEGWVYIHYTIYGDGVGDGLEDGWGDGNGLGDGFTARRSYPVTDHREDL